MLTELLRLCYILPPNIVSTRGGSRICNWGGQLQDWSCAEGAEQRQSCRRREYVGGGDRSLMRVGSAEKWEGAVLPPQKSTYFGAFSCLVFITNAQYTPPTRLNCRVESHRQCAYNSQLVGDILNESGQICQQRSLVASCRGSEGTRRLS